MMIEDLEGTYFFPVHEILSFLGAAKSFLLVLRIGRIKLQNPPTIVNSECIELLG